MPLPNSERDHSGHLSLSVMVALMAEGRRARKQVHERLTNYHSKAIV